MVVLGTTIHESAGRMLSLAPRNSWMVGPSPTMTECGASVARYLSPASFIICVIPARRWETSLPEIRNV
jgi:hypothetical protein